MKTLKIQKFKLTPKRFATILVAIGMADLNMWEAANLT